MFSVIISFTFPKKGMWHVNISVCENVVCHDLSEFDIVMLLALQTLKGKKIYISNNTSKSKGVFKL